jgi:hypothetical protein
MMNPSDMSSAPQPSSPQGQAPAQGDKSAVEGQLLQLLIQAKQVAEQNGIDFQAVLAKAMGGGEAGSPPIPASP